MHGSDSFTLPAKDLDQVVACTEGIWEDLRGASLLVTGGSGFFGRWMLETLLLAEREFSLDLSVCVLTRDRKAFARRMPFAAGHPMLELLEGDVRGFTLGDRSYTHVLHMAAETNTLMTDPSPETYFDVIVRGTERVVDAALSCGALRLLLVSSGAVYGAQPLALPRVTEDATLAPRPDDLGAAYGQAKRSAEFLANAKCVDSDLCVTSARCFAFVGPGLPLESGFAVGNFIGDALRYGRIVVKGDGSPRRSYMYAGDLAIWLWTMLVKGERGRPYNVGSDEEVSIASLAGMVARHVDPPAEVEVLGEGGLRGVGSRYVPDVSRARTELGLEITVDLDEALARTVDWYREVSANG